MPQLRLLDVLSSDSGLCLFRESPNASRMQMKFYVDECLSPQIADAISAKRSCRAVHASRDLGFSGRDDQFHVAESRRRDEILFTSNHRDFKRDSKALRGHPGIVVLNPGAWTNTEDLLGGIQAVFAVFRLVRIGAKPPLRNSMRDDL